MVYQQTASDLKYSFNLDFIDPAIQRIEITELTDSIFDWIKILEDAEILMLIDSVFANLVDQLNINPTSEKFYIRKWNRNVDGNPVLLGNWKFPSVVEPTKSNRTIGNPEIKSGPTTINNSTNIIDNLQQQLSKIAKG